MRKALEKKKLQGSRSDHKARDALRSERGGRGGSGRQGSQGEARFDRRPGEGPRRSGGPGGGRRHGQQSQDMMDVNYETVLERRVTREGFSRLADDSQRKLRQLISPSAADVTPPQQAGDAAPTSTTAVSETQEPPNAGGGFRLPNWLAPSRSYLKSREAPTPVPGDGKQLPEVHDPRAQTPAPTPAEAPAATASSGADRGFARARQRKKDEETTAASPPQAAPSKLSDLMTSLPKEAQNAAGAGLHLDPWQAEALDALMAGSHLVVDAPTSAGKTRVIEALLEKRMKEGMKLIYTTPVKSLSNDKYREFCEKYGKERVGINTGDFKENLGAPIILATLETYRNSLLGVEPNMARRVVVYDEYHYLQDESRGSAWEESIILTPKHSQLVLLSASVPNADEFADWITSLTGKECKVIRVQKRPVPLVDLVWTRHGWVFADDLKLSPEETRELGRRLKTAQAGVRRYLKAKLTHQEVLEPVAAALALNLGPIVVYAGRRSDVEAIAHAIARHLRMEYSGPEAEKMRNRINNLPGWDYVPHELQRLVKRYGIAYHHSGMIPPGRVAIETLLKEGLLRVCTGTMGISLGVNFAVRSALVADESRPSESGETRYSGTEVMQMLGRAGRRGHDKQGFSLWVNLGRYALQKPTGREPTRSSLKFDPTTVLGILGQHENFAFLSDFYKKSFFMRGKDETQVLIEDHDLIGSLLYRNHGIERVPCDDIPKTFQQFQEGHKRSRVPCPSCPAKPWCHPTVAKARGSVLQGIVRHLQNVGALEGPKPTRLGQLARHFPQAGGLIVARWIARGEMDASNFRAYLQAMAVFCAAHFKDISDANADVSFLNDLEIPRLIDSFYPEQLFPELYDDLGRAGEGHDGLGGRVFREYNPGAASIVTSWLDHHASWDELVETHASKHFSAGDCMMVLFRFSTFLQSCSRIGEYNDGIAAQAKELQRQLLREPLDARNRMLMEETDEFESEDGLPLQLVTTPGEG